MAKVLHFRHLPIPHLTSLLNSGTSHFPFSPLPFPMEHGLCCVQEPLGCDSIENISCNPFVGRSKVVQNVCGSSSKGEGISSIQVVHKPSCPPSVSHPGHALHWSTSSGDPESSTVTIVRTFDTKYGGNFPIGLTVGCKRKAPP